MKTIDLSIIIPTLNEEHYIGKLLDSILAQTCRPLEIVIIDAYSSDRTLEVINSKSKIYDKIKVHQISKYTISRQRNYGVEKTHSEHILFFDADVILKDSKTLEKYYQNILNYKPDVSICTNVPDSKNWKDKFLFSFADHVMRLCKPFWVTAVGINMYVKRSWFKRVNGFDEQVMVAEDFEIVQRLVKKGANYQIFTNPVIISSVRRWRKYGRIRTFLMMMKSLMFIKMVGYKQNPITKEYEFGNHDSV